MEKKRTKNDLVKEFTIKTSKWLHGIGNKSMLLDPYNNKMCCLGFASRACGLSGKSIEEVAEPGELELEDQKIINGALPFLLSNNFDNNLVNSRVSKKLMSINDNPDTTISFKKKEIKKIFKENGVKVNFV